MAMGSASHDVLLYSKDSEQAAAERPRGPQMVSSCLERTHAAFSSTRGLQAVVWHFVLVRVFSYLCRVCNELDE